tara:strand:+ start:1629 stop:1859 length:231 start_codon:yes stop_codon:yes gene_type:complete
MNPQILFNFSLALLTTAVILLFKGLFLLGFTCLILSIGTSITWLMAGFFGKFEYEPINEICEDERDDEGKGVLKPF